MGSEQLKGAEATPSRKKSKKMPFKPIEMPKCPKCGKSVYAAEEKLAGGHKWHTGCFKCSMCNKMLDSTNSNERDSALFCKPATDEGTDQRVMDLVEEQVLSTWTLANSLGTPSSRTTNPPTPPSWPNSL